MALQDYLNTGDAYAWGITTNNRWLSQSFLTTSEYDCTSVKVKLYAIGSPTGNLTVSLYAEDGAGKPTGSALASGTINSASVTSTSPGLWYEAVFLTPPTLADATKYCIVLEHDNANGSNYINWRSKAYPSPYSDGTLALSEDNGASYTTKAGEDQMFETYGTATGVVDTINREATLSGEGDFEVTPKIYVRPSTVILGGIGGFSITPSITNVNPQGDLMDLPNLAEVGEDISTNVKGPTSGADLRWNNVVPVELDAFGAGTPEQIAWEDTRVETGAYATQMDDTLFWFEKTHLLPRVVQELGNIVSAQTFPVELHNADRKEIITVTSVINNLDTGISIDGIPATPFVIQPQHSISAIVTVDTQGALTVDSDYTFVTSVGSYTFYITGSRIVLLPIRPQAPLREHLLFSTTILEGTDGTEQRIANRKAPRSMFEFTINSDRKRMEMLLFDRQNKVLATPAWHEPSFVTSPVTAMDLTVNVDNTDYANFYVGGYAIVFQDEYTYDALAITAMTSTSLTFGSEIAVDYKVGTQVMPLMLANVQEVVAAAKNLNNVQTFNLKLTVDASDQDIADASAFNTRDGIPFLDGPNMVEGGALQEALEQKRLVLDNTTGLFDYFSQWDRNKRRSIKGFKTNTRQELWEFRQFLHFLKGQQVSFYIPTFSKDLVPNQTLVNANSSFTMDYIGYGVNARGRDPKADIRIWLNDGTLLERTIVGYSELSTSEEQLTMNLTWPYDIEPEDIERIEFIEKVRINVDDVMITHYNALGQTKTFVQTKEVFD